MCQGRGIARARVSCRKRSCPSTQAFSNASVALLYSAWAQSLSRMICHCPSVSIGGNSARVLFLDEADDIPLGGGDFGSTHAGWPS